MKKSLLLLVTLLASLSAWAGEVTVNIVGNGTVDVTYNGTTVENITSGWNTSLSGSLTLTMTPAQGYTLQELQMVTLIGSSTESTTENNGVFTYTIGKVGINTITYTIVFSQAGAPTYTLSGPDGMIFSVGGETVTLAEEGQRVDITLPAPGNHSYWVVTSSDASIQQDDANHFHFTMPAKSVIVTAQKYTQTAHYVIDESTHGRVMVDGSEPGTEGHYAGENIHLSPRGDNGYEYQLGTLTATNDLTNEPIDLTYKGDDTWTFTMPDAQVTVSATFTKVTITSYVDGDGVVHENVKAIPLDETTTSLGVDEQETWYVASGTLNYTQTLNIAGDVHLILANGAVMNIGTEAAPVSGIGIDGSEYESTLTIYGQTLDDDTAGHLNINTEKECIEVAGDYAQHSGNVTANSVNENGVVTWYNFAFTGGTLYITAKANAIYTNKVDILGGKLSAVCVGNYFGINSPMGVATIGWKNADDEFTVSNFAVTVKIVDGQAFTDGENIYDSTTPTETFWNLTNVTLRPVPRYTFNSTTGELALIWGPFNSDNKWGDDVPAGAVTSVTATSEVSFTYYCSSMFGGFSNCTSMDLSRVNTEKCIKMNEVFRDCSSLKTLDLSNWNTSSVMDMNRMFDGCTNLETLDVTGFDTGNVDYMNEMFRGCSSLTSLDLSNFKTTNLRTTHMMFGDCEILTTIYVGEGWSTEKVNLSSQMFSDCNNLVGGMGTTYDAKHIDAEYAHIDGGVDNPGYLTGLFSITLPESVEHGTLSASQGDKVLVNGDKVITGSTVTLTVTPDNGYELETLTIVTVDTNTSDGAPMLAPRRANVDYTSGSKPNTYTFQMPAAPVTVNATFQETVVTSVEDINAAQPKSGQRYNVMGQPVGNDYKGIVIENGKKRVIK